MFFDYNQKLLSQIHPDLSISMETDFALQVYMSELVQTMFCGKHKTLDEIKLKMKKVLGDTEIYKHAVRQGEKAISKKGNNLGFTVPILKTVSHNCEKMESEDDLLFMAGVGDYYVSEILELAGNATKKKITMMNVEYAFRNDIELMHSYKYLKVNPFRDYIPEVTEKSSLFEIRFALGKKGLVKMEDDMTFETEFIQKYNTKEKLFVLMFTPSPIEKNQDKPKPKSLPCNPKSPKATSKEHECNPKTGRYIKKK